MTTEPLPPPTPVLHSARLTPRPIRLLTREDWLAHREERS